MVVVGGHLAGITLATVAALAFAVYMLCVRLGTRDGDVLGVMLVSLLVNVVVIVPLVGVFHGLPTVTGQSLVAFAAAGLFGSLLARVVIMKSIETIGASRTSPVVASNVLFASAFAIVLFDERLTAVHFLGIVLIIVGVAVITWETSDDPDVGISSREFGLSLTLPVLGAFLLGVEPIFVNLGLDGGSAVLPGVGIKAVAATTGFVLYLLAADGLRSDMLRWGPGMQWYLGAGLTSTLGIVAYFAALEVAPVVLVVPLLQTSPLIVVLLSALFLPAHLERVSSRLVVGALVVVLGATLVSLYG